MEASVRPHGVLAAALTAVAPDLTPDLERSVAHARWLLENGCDGLNILGTTGEAASFSVAQRAELMRALRDAGLPLGTMLVGTGAAALADTVVLTKLALELGFGGALVIPPFYYKDVAEDGVFAYYAGLIERVGSDALRLYLYNFPKMSGVALTPSLVARLVEAFPRTLAGIKDSSGDMPYAETLHRAHPRLDVFPSSEATLVESRRAGFAGCISASANVTAPYCAPVWRDGDLELQAQLAAMRTAISAAPLIPAVRYLASELHRDPAWLRAMPPLGGLSPAEQTALGSGLRAAGYRAPSGSLA